ncbi:MAG: Hsp20/alpha crystallin family protein [Gammaproteobacteria bacterium]|nr:Hsp20/alpha crystallin family protein [Gammaproteobacteria bacterium]MDH5614206.1 Hsp20/alpha crystallin family protein [Gammaproteobacteria bacterium]
MTLIKYDPWTQLARMQNELSRVFDTRLPGQNDDNVVTSDWAPAVDIKEEADRFVIHADIPGVDSKDIDIHMEDGILTIKGERESEKKEERDGYKRIERAFGTFYRRFSLPDTANPEKISAKNKNGVLEISIAKQEKGLARKIEIES